MNVNPVQPGKPVKNRTKAKGAVPVPPVKRRLRSRNVIMGGIAVTVLTICSCGMLTQREERHCVDTATNNVIDDDNCDSNRVGSRWYYGGSSAKGKMTGGSFQRGGFGGFFGGGG